MKKTIMYLTALFTVGAWQQAVAEEHTVTNDSGTSSMYGVYDEFEVYSEDNVEIPAPIQPELVEVTEQVETTVEPPASGTSSMYGQPDGTTYYTEQPPAPASKEVAPPVRLSALLAQPKAVALPPMAQMTAHYFSIAKLTPCDYATKLMYTSLRLKESTY